MSQDYKESLEISKLTAETEKLTIETNKLRAEIQKINRETTVARGNRLRFWVGNVAVPISVAGLTFLAVYLTGYFNAWQTKNENNEHDYRIKAAKFVADTVEFAKIRGRLYYNIDSLTGRSNALTENIADLTTTINDLRNQLNKGVTPNRVINALAKKYDSVKTIFQDSIKNMNARQMYFNSMTLDECQKRAAWLGGDTAIKGQYIRILVHLLDSLNIKHI